MSVVPVVDGLVPAAGLVPVVPGVVSVVSIVHGVPMVVVAVIFVVVAVVVSSTLSLLIGGYRCVVWVVTSL